MMLGVYLATILCFGLAFYFATVIKTCDKVVTIGLAAIETIFNHHFDDNTKQKRVQQAAFNMARQFIILMFKCVLVMTVTVIPMAVAHYFKYAFIDDTSSYAMRVDVLGVTTVLAMSLCLLWKQFSKKYIDSSAGGMASDIPYSRIDRVVHSIAFGSSSLQKMLADMERKKYSKQWGAAKTDRPIFITSLPRSGTTILLEVLRRLPNIATHTYRDMPFILTPVIWNKWSSRIRKKSVAQERAHADGLMVSEDSAEAFEEVLWVKAYAHKYSPTGITLWEKSDAKFLGYFKEHMKKIIYLRGASQIREYRYVSKNNGSIARTKALNEMFPHGKIIVPVRDPFEHASSLLRQHLNFRRLHTKEPFVAKYMEDIGHLEFGQLHRPIKFPKMTEAGRNKNPENINYWVTYWIAAFEYLIKLDHLSFLSYERFCSKKEEGVRQLCTHLDLKPSVEEIAFASRLLRDPSPKRQNEFEIESSLKDQASTLYQSILNKCILNPQRVTCKTKVSPAEI